MHGALAGCDTCSSRARFEAGSSESELSGAAFRLEGLLHEEAEFFEKFATGSLKDGTSTSNGDVAVRAC